MYQHFRLFKREDWVCFYVRRVLLYVIVRSYDDDTITFAVVYGKYGRSVVRWRELAGGLGPQGRLGCAINFVGPPSVDNAWSEVVYIFSEFSWVCPMTLECSDLSTYFVVGPQECFREKRSNIFARGGWILCVHSCFKRPLSNLGCNLSTFGPVEVRKFGNVRNVPPESV